MDAVRGGSVLWLGRLVEASGCWLGVLVVPTVTVVAVAKVLL